MYYHPSPPTHLLYTTSSPCLITISPPFLLSPFSSSGDAQDVRRGSGLGAVFLTRDRFAVLDKTRQLLVKNFQNEVVKRSTPPLAGK